MQSASVVVAVVGHLLLMLAAVEQEHFLLVGPMLQILAPLVLAVLVVHYLLAR
jgi:hypothetical protein